MAGYNSMLEDHLGVNTDGVTTLAHEVTVNDSIYHVEATLYRHIAIRTRGTLVLNLKRNLHPMHKPSDGDKLVLNPAHEPSNENELILNPELKLIWRDQTRFPEGVILSQLDGMYGVCQPIVLGDVKIHGYIDVVRSRAGNEPSEYASAFGKANANVEINGVQLDDMRVFSQLLMQPGRPLREARDTFELVAGMIGALMVHHWAFIGSHVLHRDISVNNIQLPVNEHNSKQPEWEQLSMLGVDGYALQFTVPEWHKIFNSDSKCKYQKMDKLLWEVDPKQRLQMLQKVMAAHKQGWPFGFILDLDMASILEILRKGTTDFHSHHAGTPMFMAIGVLDQMFNSGKPHSFKHDLESFFWVLLYVVAGHIEPPGSCLNEFAERLLEGMQHINQQVLAGQKVLMRDAITKSNLVEKFETSWARDLGPLLRELAQCVKDFEEMEESDSDSCFEKVILIFLKMIGKLRPIHGDH